MVKPAISVSRAWRTPSECLLRLTALEGRQDAGFLDVADQMRVAVDEAGQHRRPRQVDDSGACRWLAGARRLDALDALATHDDELVAEQLATLGVDQPAGADDGHRLRADGGPCAEQEHDDTGDGSH